MLHLLIPEQVSQCLPDLHVQSECSFDLTCDSYRVTSDRAYRPGQEVLINVSKELLLARVAVPLCVS